MTPPVACDDSDAVTWKLLTIISVVPMAAELALRWWYGLRALEGRGRLLVRPDNFFLPVSEPLFSPSCAPTVKRKFLAVSFVPLMRGLYHNADNFTIEALTIETSKPWTPYRSPTSFLPVTEPSTSLYAHQSRTAISW